MAEAEEPKCEDRHKEETEHRKGTSADTDDPHTTSEDSFHSAASSLGLPVSQLCASSALILLYEQTPGHTLNTTRYTNLSSKTMLCSGATQSDNVQSVSGCKCCLTVRVVSDCKCCLKCNNPMRSEGVPHDLDGLENTGSLEEEHFTTRPSTHSTPSTASSRNTSPTCEPVGSPTHTDAVGAMRTDGVHLDSTGSLEEEHFTTCSSTHSTPSSRNASKSLIRDTISSSTHSDAVGAMRSKGVCVDLDGFEKTGSLEEEHFTTRSSTISTPSSRNTSKSLIRDTIRSPTHSDAVGALDGDVIDLRTHGSFTSPTSSTLSSLNRSILSILTRSHSDQSSGIQSTRGTSLAPVELLQSMTQEEAAEMLEQAKKTAAYKKTECDAAIDKLKGMSADMKRQSIEVRAAISSHAETLTRAITKRSEFLMRRAEETFVGSIMNEIVIKNAKLEKFSANLQKNLDEAERLAGNLHGEETLKLASSVSSQLTKPFEFSPLEHKTVTFSLSSRMAKSSEEQVNILMGNVECMRKGLSPKASKMYTYKYHKVVQSQGSPLKPAFKNAIAPRDCCHFETSIGLGHIEAFESHGLFFTWPGKTRFKAENMNMYCSSVCVNEYDDAIILYASTRHAVAKAKTAYGSPCRFSSQQDDMICMYDIKADLPQLKRLNVGIPEGRNWYITSICTSLSGRLAVADYSTIRFDSCTGRLSRSVESFLEGNRILGEPQGIAWALDESAVYVCDHGFADVIEQSVIKLQLSPTVEVLWRTEMQNQPHQVTLIDNLLYVTKTEAADVSILSEEDGSLLETIGCHGVVRAVKKINETTVKLLCYKHCL